MAARKNLDKLISRNNITEEMKLIKGSDTDYITPTGKVYKDYGDNKFYPKTNFINKENGYLYVSITYPEGQRQRRVHILVAEAYIPNPENLPVVMHKDNNKANPIFTNLKWGTVSENTQQAFNDKLQVNAKGWEDSQSIPISVFDMKQNLIGYFGSVGEASRKFQITKTTILNQCNHNLKTKPRCGYYFRYFKEYQENGFVL